MQLTEHNAGNNNFVRRIETDAVVIGEERHEDSLILAPDDVVTGWPPKHASEIEEQHLEAIFALNPDLVLIGTGPQQVFPKAEVMAAFLSRGIGVEAMDTAAACRTFNVLVSEERHAVAALIL